MSLISPRNTARVSIRPSCSLASYTAAFWPVAVLPAPRTLNADWSVFGKIIMPVMPIRTVGPTRVSRSCAIRPSAAPGANNAKDGPALARVPNDLRGYSIRHDLTIDKRRLDLSWTYETLY